MVEEACAFSRAWRIIPQIQYQPEESVAAVRREALRAVRILLMCPNRRFGPYAPAHLSGFSPYGIGPKKLSLFPGNVVMIP